MALSAPYAWNKTGGKVINVLIRDKARIFRGALVGTWRSGSAVGLLDNWRDNALPHPMDFVGIAIPQEDSLVGNSDNVLCPVDVSGGLLVKAQVLGVISENQNSRLVYAKDENTLTITETPGGTPIGIAFAYPKLNNVADVWLYSVAEARAWKGD